ncbi:MAG TPA: hypothetical protein P5567_06445 [Kiritimatiellia bacterium]|nr:hypothetical protein [Kiritimatiellia bacterium]HRZ12076.1 hypothetical protein [Kiritimatiellia bacterium]HSA18166.1 hypothetical protein [Kiritimatiellia bacterium]
MKDVLLCLAAFLLLTWVIYLKAQIVKLLQQNERMAALLKLKLDKDKAGMEVGGDDQVIGKKPGWMK